MTNAINVVTPIGSGRVTVTDRQFAIIVACVGAALLFAGLVMLSETKV